jgi:hypothetical protein
VVAATARSSGRRSPRSSPRRPGSGSSIATLFAVNAAVLGRDMDVAETGPRGMATASTDMGNVSQRLRAIHPCLGIGSLPAVNHQPAFAAATVTPAADRAVRDGAVLLAQTGVDAVLTPDRREHVGKKAKPNSVFRTVACSAFPVQAKHATVRDKKSLTLRQPRRDPRA